MEFLRPRKPSVGKASARREEFRRGPAHESRRFGSAALDLAWTAAGRLDIYWERNLSPWDMAAGILLVREAGGYVSDCNGHDAMLPSGDIVAGNETMHRELLSLLKIAASKP